MVERQADNAPAYFFRDGQHARFVAEPPPHDGLVQWGKMEHSGYPVPTKNLVLVDSLDFFWSPAVPFLA